MNNNGILFAYLLRKKYLYKSFQNQLSYIKISLAKSNPRHEQMPAIIQYIYDAPQLLSHKPPLFYILYNIHKTSLLEGSKVSLILWKKIYKLMVIK